MLVLATPRRHRRRGRVLAYSRANDNPREAPRVGIRSCYNRGVNLVDAFVLAFAGVLVLVAARLLEAGRRSEIPTRAEILARFDHQPARLWMSVAALALADLVMLALAFLAFGAADEALYGFGAHGWVWGVTLVAAAGLVTVVLLTVLRIYLRAS